MIRFQTGRQDQAVLVQRKLLSKKKLLDMSEVWIKDTEKAAAAVGSCLSNKQASYGIVIKYVIL